MKDSTPILIGRLVDKNDGSKGMHIVVWCPVCNIEHTHGWPEESYNNMLEHRVAHCASGPLTDTGYYIMPRAVQAKLLSIEAQSAKPEKKAKKK
jgi:hypothetical protein